MEWIAVLYTVECLFVHSYDGLCMQMSCWLPCVQYMWFSSCTVVPRGSSKWHGVLIWDSNVYVLLVHVIRNKSGFDYPSISFVFLDPIMMLCLAEYRNVSLYVRGAKLSIDHSWCIGVLLTGSYHVIGDDWIHGYTWVIGWGRSRWHEQLMRL